MQLASYLLIGHVELGGELLFQVVKLQLKSISLLLQGQALDLKLLTQFLQRKEEDNDGIIVCALPNVYALVWNSSSDARKHQKSKQILYPSADVRNDQCI